MELGDKRARASGGAEAYEAGPHTIVIVAGPTYVIATWKDVVISCWRGEVAASAVREMHSASTGLLTRYPNGYHSLAIVEGGMPLPSAEARQAAQEHMSASAGDLLSAAMVIAGAGFWASAFRGVVMGIKLFSRSDHPQGVFADLPPAVAWMQPHLGASADEPALLTEAMGLRHLAGPPSS